jgi:prepilin-type N-terminal cleavage/methylation domain-containing protein
MFNAKNKEAGFTLLEIIIVLTILGFLIAMIAPRLGDIGSSASKTISSGNIKNLADCLVMYQQQKRHLPNKVITIVNATGREEYKKPLVDDGDPDNGPETISWQFDGRIKPKLHILNREEAEELRRMGIHRMMVLNDHVGSTDEVNPNKGKDPDNPVDVQTLASGDYGRPFYPAKVQEGLAVLMVGAGADDEGSDIKERDDVRVDGEKIAYPQWMYRIIVGVGTHCSLVTEGMIQNEGMDPEAMQEQDYITYKYYCIVLQRLENTIKRIRGSEFRRYIEVVDSAYGTSGEKDERAEMRVINIRKPQKAWQVEVFSPLGYKWPEDTVDEWIITNTADTEEHLGVEEITGRK